jgi:hypothetical protein
MNIPGLPEGVDAVRIGVCGSEEFEVIGTMDPSVRLLVKGPRTGSTSQIVVKPSAGWKFIPARSPSADYSDGSFAAVKLLAAPATITATVRFKVETVQEQATVNAALERLKELPGFEEIKEA